MNDVILEMRKGLSALEEKVLLMVVYSAGIIEKDRIYEFSISQFCDMCGLSTVSNRNRIISAFKAIDRISYRSTAKTGGYRIKWFDELSYEIRGDIVSYSFFEEIIPYLNDWFFERTSVLLSPEALCANFSGFSEQEE